jgi:hypothetical protein
VLLNPPSMKNDKTFLFFTSTNCHVRSSPSET